MKTSNVLLVLWVLLIAGLALVAVYFVRTGDKSDPVEQPPVQVTPQPGGGQGTGSGKTDPRKPAKGETGRTPRPSPKVSITGRVIDGEGKAVASATVRLLQPAKPAAAAPAELDRNEIHRIAHIVTIFDDDWDRLRPLARWTEAPPSDPNRAAGPSLAESASDAEGKFRFDLPPGAGPGPFRLSVRVDAVGSASANNVLPGQDVELMLSTGGIVSGTVIGEADERGVAAARVVFDSGDREYSATTDESGAFRIESMPPGRYTVRAGAKGRTPVLDQPVQVVRGEAVTIKLPRGVILRIKTVLDESGGAEAEQPLAGVDVVALEENSSVYVTGKSNDYGIVEFAGLPAGSWIVNGRTEKFISQGDTLVKLQANQQMVEESVLFETAVPTPIEVVDETGVPVAGVTFFSGDGNDSYDVVRSEKLPGVTDRDGKWTFPFEFDGPRCMAFGFLKGYGLVHVYPDDYSEGAPAKVVMRRAVRVFGKVTDENGAAVADAIVRFTIDPVEADQTIGDTVTVQVRTDAQGRYDFAYVPEGHTVSVEAETEDSWSDDMPTVEPEAGKREHEVDLRLEAAPAPRFVTPGNGGK